MICCIRLIADAFVWISVLSPASSARCRSTPSTCSLLLTLIPSEQAERGSWWSGESCARGDQCWESSSCHHQPWGHLVCQRLGRAGVASAAGVSSTSQQLSVGSPGQKGYYTHHQNSRTVPVCCLLGWPGTAAFHQQKLSISFRRAMVCLRVTGSLHQTYFQV